jgi:hypothetical protein
MMFKSPTQPYCRCCGGPIKKRTEFHWFGRDMAQEHNQDRPSHHGARPATKADAQRLVNGQIISVSRYPARDGEPSYIGSANVWDGETYEDHLFCKQVCAVRFGRMCAEAYPTISTKTADAARAAREAQQ